MTAQRDPSVDELRRESERTRAALTSTVVHLRDKVSDTADDLKERLSPTNIKQEVKDYVREGSEQFFHSIQRKARENPLQAVAIGAGLAYPLYGLFKSVPVPLMLVGAGLWLSRQKSGSGAGGSDTHGVADSVKEAVSEGATSISKTAREVATSVSTGVQSVMDKVQATAHDIRDSAAELGQSVVDSVKDNAAEATQTVSGTVSDLKSQASEIGEQSRNSLVDFMNRNPLLVGGIGLAIGAFIAASLPPSDAENRIFGERSDDLKEMAMEAASQGVERAKDVATGVVADVSTAMDREGLNAEGLAKAVENVTEGVKSVVDKGLKTALGEAPPPQSPSAAFQPNKS